MKWITTTAFARRRPYAWTDCGLWPCFATATTTAIATAYISMDGVSACDAVQMASPSGRHGLLARRFTLQFTDPFNRLFRLTRTSRHRPVYGLIDSNCRMGTPDIGPGRRQLDGRPRLIQKQNERTL
jgi:hypothetical protein